MEHAASFSSGLVKILEGLPFQPDMYEELSLATIGQEPFNLSLPANKELSSQDVEHIKITLVSLNEKLKAFSIT